MPSVVDELLSVSKCIFVSKISSLFLPHFISYQANNMMYVLSNQSHFCAKTDGDARISLPSRSIKKLAHEFPTFAIHGGTQKKENVIQ